MMGFLHKLWDETLAGPAPETGLGKLRKYNSYSGGSTVRSTVADDIPISRSITIVRSQSGFGTTTTTTSIHTSPHSAPVTPRSPLTPGTTGPGGDFKKFTRIKSSPADSADNRSPTIYYWLIMSALDRC